jgi:hypothetical protein
MSSITFDTLKYTKRLEEAGVECCQAEAQAMAHKDAMQEACDDFASKSETTALQKDSDSYKNDVSGIKKDLDAVKTNIAVLMWGQGLIILTVVIPAIKNMLGL